MNAKRILNTLLSRSFGYEIRRVPGDLDRLVGFDETEIEIIRVVSERTMTSPIRLQNAIGAVRYVSANSIPGAIVECGVWRGGSSMAMAMASLLDPSETERDLYLFDTFTGMTAPQTLDFRLQDKKSASSLNWSAEASLGTDAKYSNRGLECFASKEDVAAGFAGIAIDQNRIHLIQGDVMQTFQDQCPQQVAVLRLDTDWYESTLHELRVGWPLLSTGGVLIIDDYDSWAGARKATNDYFEEINYSPLMTRMDEGRVILKL